MTGGAGWKVSPSLDIEHELIETLIFDGILTLQSQRLQFWADKKSQATG